MRSSKNAAIIATLTLATLLAATVRAEVPLHLRVIFQTDPAHQATIAWTTMQPLDDAAIEVRRRGDEAWAKITADSGKFAPGAPDAWYHHVRLTQLDPNTVYEIRNPGDAETRWFRTASDQDEPFVLLSGGDSRSGIDERKQMNRMMARLVAEQAAAGRPPVLALAHGGDFIVDGTKLPLWLDWLEHHSLTTTNDGQLLPVIPTRGNHDMGRLFNQVWAFAADNDNYFVTQLSPSAALITLNTETSTAGDQRDWLAQQLPELRARSRWLLTQYHKPAFPAVKIPSGAYTNWVPLFEEHRVDLAIESDGHVVKRTPPIRDNKVDSAGVVYIGEGGLGVGQRTPKTNRWYLQPTADKCGAMHHLHLLTFTPERLNVKVIKLGGDVFDEFDLLPRR
jgi:hypothetical protein